MDSDNLFDGDYIMEHYVINSKKQYMKALEYINKNATLPYVTNREFLSQILKLAISEKKEYAEEWITKIFGEADWDNLEW